MTPPTANERSRVFVRDIEPDPGWEVRVIDPGEEVAIEPGTWEEYVPTSYLMEAVEALQKAYEWLERVGQTLGGR